MERGAGTAFLYIAYTQLKKSEDANMRLNPRNSPSGYACSVDNHIQRTVLACFAKSVLVGRENTS